MKRGKDRLSGAKPSRRNRLLRRAGVARRRVERSHPTLRALAWAIIAGLLFVFLNTLMRGLAMELPPFQTQFLRYVCGFLVMLPLVLRAGFVAYRPRNIPGQFARGAIHTIGLSLWFTAIAQVTLADATAIGFTGPIFIMIGAAWMFGERMRWERWVAALIGFAGVVIVVAPKLSGSGGFYNLLMLASCPVFAASILITKALSRYERPSVIVVWQSISVALFSLPLALLNWTTPGPMQWLAFLACGLLGSTGHYCLTRSFSVADISATQSTKFLELVWASLLGWLVFSDEPSRSTLVGGAVICAATVWIAHRETRAPLREPLA